MGTYPEWFPSGYYLAVNNYEWGRFNVIFFAHLASLPYPSISEGAKGTFHLFGTKVTEDDKLDYLHGMTSKLGENSILMELVNNNDRNAIMLGDDPKVVDKATLAHMNPEQGMNLSTLLLDLFSKRLGAR